MASYLFKTQTQIVFDRIANKWSMNILQILLKHGSIRFTQLNRLLPKISRKILSQNLHNLEEIGVITRTVSTQSPVSVSYTLTPLGQSFLKKLIELSEWIEAQWADVTPIEAIKFKFPPEQNQ